MPSPSPPPSSSSSSIIDHKPPPLLPSKKNPHNPSHHILTPYHHHHHFPIEQPTFPSQKIKNKKVTDETSACRSAIRPTTRPTVRAGFGVEARRTLGDRHARTRQNKTRPVGFVAVWWWCWMDRGCVCAVEGERMRRGRRDCVYSVGTCLRAEQSTAVVGLRMYRAREGLLCLGAWSRGWGWDWGFVLCGERERGMDGWV